MPISTIVVVQRERDKGCRQLGFVAESRPGDTNYPSRQLNAGMSETISVINACDRYNLGVPPRVCDDTVVVWTHIVLPAAATKRSPALYEAATASARAFTGS